MKAWRIIKKGHPSQSLVREDINPPLPGAQQIRVRMAASVINFADILVCQGIYQNRPSVPFTPGLETAGVIEAVGAESRFAVGEHVAGMAALPNGAFAEFSLIDDAAAVRFPSDIPFVDVTILYNTFLTAHIALFRRANLQRGEYLLVLAGAGGVGSAAIQLGKIKGATVIAAASTRDKLDYCTELGADHVINYQTEDLYQRLGEFMSSNGIDVCFDPVGGEMTEPVRRRLAFEGRYVIIGFTSGEIPAFPANHILVKHYSVIGSAWTEYLTKNRAVVDQAMTEILKLYQAGEITTGKKQLVPFDDLPNALTAIERRETTGRLILNP